MNELVRFARSSSHLVSSEAVPSQLEIEQSFREVLRWIGKTLIATAFAKPPVVWFVPFRSIFPVIVRTPS